jgi:hypothetical protein
MASSGRSAMSRRRPLDTGTDDCAERPLAEAGELWDVLPTPSQSEPAGGRRAVHEPAHRRHASAQDLPRPRRPLADRARTAPRRGSVLGPRQLNRYGVTPTIVAGLAPMSGRSASPSVMATGAIGLEDAHAIRERDRKQTFTRSRDFVARPRVLASQQPAGRSLRRRAMEDRGDGAA